jgi:hypothetical protein
MKKLRMIVSAVVVLAIVGSAFAFKAKIGRFCVLTTVGTGTDDNCTTFLTPDKRTTSVLGAIWKYYPTFDGNQTACTAASNHLCTTTTRLIND